MSPRRRPSLADRTGEKLAREVNRPRVVRKIVNLGPDFVGRVGTDEGYSFLRVNAAHNKRLDELLDTLMIIISIFSTLLA
jgi:hypothetical protein